MGIIQSSFFCLTSITWNKKHWETEANPKFWRNGSEARMYVFSTDVVLLYYFHISKIFPVLFSKIQYNFYQNLKKKKSKTKQKSMSENLKSIFLSVSKIYSSPTILILWDGEVLLFFFFFVQFKSRRTRKIQTTDEKRSCNKKCKVRKKSLKILYLYFIAYFTYHVNIQVPVFFYAVWDDIPVLKSNRIAWLSVSNVNALVFLRKAN